MLNIYIHIYIIYILMFFTILIFTGLTPYPPEFSNNVLKLPKEAPRAPRDLPMT